MAWNLELSPRAQQQLDKLDKTAARRIAKFLYERVGRLNDPRQIGEPLQGTLVGLWRYRVGDYRIICTLEHDRLVVLVLRIGHRREVYKR
ncbi:MAG TPA: type II toxin-antitoxin system RelE/ParE family toxin [Terriglobales bacterium]|jgi:mRNA interferase RelE/StbE|nr:type II toxin-antitoxin system RelE/ParE family toxin [Terriglobales bacterium]